MDAMDGGLPFDLAFSSSLFLLRPFHVGYSRFVIPFSLVRNRQQQISNRHEKAKTMRLTL